MVVRGRAVISTTSVRRAHGGPGPPPLPVKVITFSFFYPLPPIFMRVASGDACRKLRVFLITCGFNCYFVATQADLSAAPAAARDDFLTSMHSLSSFVASRLLLHRDNCVEEGGHAACDRRLELIHDRISNLAKGTVLSKTGDSNHCYQPR